MLFTKHRVQEMNPNCRVLLHETIKWCETVSPGSGNSACLFGNILDMFPLQTFIGTSTYSEKLKASLNCRLNKRGYCYTHESCCDNSASMPSFDVSGLPCPDMSSAGAKLKRAGLTSGCYMAHGRWCRQQRVPLLLLECTPEAHLDKFIHSFGFFCFIRFSTNNTNLFVPILIQISGIKKNIIIYMLYIIYV